MSPPQPLPLVTLRLSHPNILDAVLNCDGHPLYSFDSSLNHTHLYRCFPHSDDLVHVASLQWPAPAPPSPSRRKSKSFGPLIKIGNYPQQQESDFLKLHSGVLSSPSRKFHIPGIDRALKWRRMGTNGFECTSPVTSTPVATYEPANLTSPAKIKIYTTEVASTCNFRQTKIAGVCTLLMDYIVLTTMLLVADREDPKTMAAIRSTSTSVASGSPSSSSPVSPISPITPFSANQSPSASSSYDSWYRSATAALASSSGNGTFLSTTSGSCYGTSSTGTCISIRSTPSTSSHQRLRPRTSPSSGTLSTLANASFSSHSMRRAASQHVRPGAQWQSQRPTHSYSSFEDDDDFEESPVLDIRPSHSHTHSQSSQSGTPSPTQTPTKLRVEVPPMVATTRTPTRPRTAHAGATPTISAHPQHMPFLKTDPADMPPPYEVIEWTVRVKTPRRVRSSDGQ